MDEQDTIEKNNRSFRVQFLDLSIEYPLFS